MMWHGDNVLLTHILETCMVLQTNVTPINVLKIKNKIKGKKLKNK